jgi:hypothetical protein
MPGVDALGWDGGRDRKREFMDTSTLNAIEKWPGLRAIHFGRLFRMYLKGLEKSSSYNEVWT